MANIVKIFNCLKVTLFEHFTDLLTYMYYFSLVQDKEMNTHSNNS